METQIQESDIEDLFQKCINQVPKIKDKILDESKKYKQYQKQYHKQYHKSEKYKQYQKQYYQENKQKILEKLRLKRLGVTNTNTCDLQPKAKVT